MAIPEQRLKTWSKLGAQVRSQRTYESIRGALADHQWRHLGRYGDCSLGSFRARAR